MNSTYNVDNKGYYGEFGGAYIPEMMYSNIEELRSKYIKICSETSFKKEFDELLKDYVGRPTPLYFASRLSDKYNTKIYLKREDLLYVQFQCKPRHQVLATSKHLDFNPKRVGAGTFPQFLGKLTKRSGPKPIENS